LGGERWEGKIANIGNTGETVNRQRVGGCRGVVAVRCGGRPEQLVSTGWMRGGVRGLAGFGKSTCRFCWER
jgi:hypothetical protein